MMVIAQNQNHTMLHVLPCLFFCLRSSCVKLVAAMALAFVAPVGPGHLPVNGLFESSTPQEVVFRVVEERIQKTLNPKS